MTRTDAAATDDAGRNVGDSAPGLDTGRSASPGREVLGYAFGLLAAAALTAASFYAVHTKLIWQPGIPVALMVLAVAQMGVHLVFFLHITTAPDNTNNVLALAFGTLIVLLVAVGTLWIMSHLNHNMMTMEQMMRMQR